MEYVVKATKYKAVVVSAPNDGYVECIFIDAPIYGNGVLLESPTGPYALIRTEAENFDELKADHKACKKLIEKVVNHYLQEQEMYLKVSVVEVDGGYAVAVVSCY